MWFIAEATFRIKSEPPEDLIAPFSQITMSPTQNFDLPVPPGMTPFAEDEHLESDSEEDSQQVERSLSVVSRKDGSKELCCISSY